MELLWIHAANDMLGNNNGIAFLERWIVGESRGNLPHVELTQGTRSVPFPMNDDPRAGDRTHPHNTRDERCCF